MRHTPSPFSQRFTRDEQGAIAIIAAFASTIIFGVVALSVDMGRATSGETEVRLTLDAAALAGARAMVIHGHDDDAVKARANATLDANLQANGYEAMIQGVPQINVDREAETVTIEAIMRVETTFGKLLGFSAVERTLEATAQMPTNNVEVVFALDFTGSMTLTAAGDSITKFEALRNITRTSVNTLFDVSTRPNGMRIGIVPWATHVRVPNSVNFAFANNVSDKCVNERGTWTTLTDVQPASGEFFGTTDTGGCSATPILPLTRKANRASVISYIDTMQPTNGATAGHLAAAWGWFALSPNWSSIWPSGSEPGNVMDSNQKIVVIMSDGEFNSTGFNHEGSAVDKSYEVFGALCENMKSDASGITIFTIGFDLGAGETPAKTNLKACATSDDHFFEPEDSEALELVFSKITDEVKHLRLK